MPYNQDFIEWIKTPVGCDGGNIKGKIWLFGLEYGGEESLEGLGDFTVINEHSYLKEDYRVNFPDAYQYNTKLTKLHAVMLGCEIQDYSRVFHATSMFGKEESSDTYKGNIYTFASPHEEERYFVKEMQEVTGCKNKKEYKNAHREFRFPVIRSWVKEHAPSVIVCFGKSQHYVLDYLRAFVSEKPDVSILKSEAVGDTSVLWGSINDGRTILFIVPFLGYYMHCLNSDERINSVGLFIRNKAKEIYGNGWSKYSDFSLGEKHQYTEPQHISTLLNEQLKNYNFNTSLLSDDTGIQESEIQKILGREISCNLGLAIKLEKILNSSASDILRIQYEYDLWVLRGLKSRKV